ncbi:MAG: hypothetical protein L6Q74_05090 [Sphaerotilus natans subsp. sulfidivorans]|uniref:hypothetical protein n=1 Tax=Sphaerotilus sulfidivorans TaxID=639200 RepID=UPI002355E12F|nr:hypothetical protein [Sphaerotilus sulfidivorans]MCK6401275.1 hypothetical protein [Sphaerotilus sulfidivorans]
MALMKCHECSALISTTAKTCPSCGAKPKRKTSITTWIVGGLSAFVVTSCIVGNEKSRKADEARAAEQAAIEAAKSPEQREAEKKAALQYEKDFQRTGAVARAVKSMMKNPDSYKLESATIMASSAVCIEHRATNSFNAIVPGYAVSPPGSDKVYVNNAQIWDKHCAEKKGTEFAHLLR